MPSTSSSASDARLHFAAVRRRLAAAGGSRGQATVEFVALLPALAALGLLCWQAVVFGQAVWLSGSAARSAARAAALSQDPLPAARRSLPSSLRHGLRVTHDADTGAVRVAIRVPVVVGGASLATTSARAQFVNQAS